MLIEVSKSQLTDSEKIASVIIHDHYAVDLNTGAHLSRSRGRSKAGRAPMWYLILPHDGKLFQSRGEYSLAKFRAATGAEAIDIARKKLTAMLNKMPHS